MHVQLYNDSLYPDPEQQAAYRRARHLMLLRRLAEIGRRLDALESRHRLERAAQIVAHQFAKMTKPVERTNRRHVAT
jgi:hypothetical protein